MKTRTTMYISKPTQIGYACLKNHMMAPFAALTVEMKVVVINLNNEGSEGGTKKESGTSPQRGSRYQLFILKRNIAAWWSTRCGQK